MIRMKPAHQRKTAFRTPDGCFEWLLMSFGLANSPPTWQAFIDQVFRDLNDDIFAYVDDFLIFAQTKEELYRKVMNALRRLIENKLYFKLSKCAFDYNNFWDSQTFIDGSFLISQYFKIGAGMSNLLKEEPTQKPFNKFDDEAQKSFENIKNSFASSPILPQWDPRLQGILETDAPGGGISGILSPKHNGVKKPVAFWSRKLQPEESRYGTPDQQLLALVDALIHFRVYLEGAQYKIILHSDHANLRYFKSTIRPNHQ
ncbi:hypothetical protein K3495_g9120 [Podosphaera aphanis]|nr:hypothetical protein K3495_g9120 [Podosphaera aphanis]